MIKFKYFLVVFPLIFLAACIGGVKQEDLIGKWNYVSYEYDNKSLNKKLANIEKQKPYIIFKDNGDAAIFSSNQILSQGTYFLDGNIIRYEEVLPNGEKRKIPFLIKKLEDKNLIFQTMDAEVKIITAIKE